jgi:SAM-dependent MidA family methyltransferase
MLQINTKPTHSLPEPSAPEKAQSEALCRHIVAVIEEAGGAIPFSAFMDLALFSPLGGYYTSSKPKLGKAGDFVTAPELSPLFSQCLAEQSAEILAHIPHGNILEFGAGTGRMAGEILNTLVTEKGFSGKYFILEPSGSLRAQQAAYLSEHYPAELFARFVWLDRLPEKFAGVILANEVLDAFPVERFAVTAGCINRLWVGVDTEESAGFRLFSKPNDLPALESLFASRDWPSTYCSEFHPQLSAWLATLSDSVTQGGLLVLDYGFPEDTYYHPDRRTGTLMCHYRHYAHADPFFYPGIQDITAHVDFSAIATAASNTGWTGLGYTDQANFLINLGLLNRLERESIARTMPMAPAALKAIQGVQTLLSPSEMGESIKVIALGKNLPQSIDLSGFSTKNRYSQLVKNRLLKQIGH